MSRSTLFAGGFTPPPRFTAMSDRLAGELRLSAKTAADLSENRIATID